MASISWSLLALVAAAAAVAPATAQETFERKRQYEIEVGVGGVFSPKYEAADSYSFKPFPIISFGRFYVPGLGQVVDGNQKNGFFFFPSFGFQGERKASDDADLTGTRPVDWALELGAGAGFRTEYFRAFAQLRQGINGHHGQVGEIGVDGIFYPMPKWEVNIGPRASFASNDYMDTYFGVTASEALASGGTLSSYNPSAGLKSVGVSTRLTYDWTDTTRLHLRAGYDRLVLDAADSPIARVGSKDQFNIGIGMSYKFSFDVFR